MLDRIAFLMAATPERVLGARNTCAISGNFEVLVVSLRSNLACNLFGKTNSPTASLKITQTFLPPDVMPGTGS